MPGACLSSQKIAMFNRRHQKRKDIDLSDICSQCFASHDNLQKNPDKGIRKSKGSSRIPSLCTVRRKLHVANAKPGHLGWPGLFSLDLPCMRLAGASFRARSPKINPWQ